MPDKLTLHEALTGLQPATSIPDSASSPAMYAAFNALTSPQNTYTLSSLAEQSRIIEERKQEQNIGRFVDDDSIFGDGVNIEQEFIAIAHIDDVSSTIEDIQNGDLELTQSVLNSMTTLMQELHRMMPHLPSHLNQEIREIAVPLRNIINEFVNRVEVV